MWSTMRPPCCASSCADRGQAILEDLAIALRGPPEEARRHARGTVEGTDEVGDVAESDVEGDIGDRGRPVRQQPRRAAESRADEVLVRRDSEDAREQPEEVERAQARPGCGGDQIDGLR